MRRWRLNYLCLSHRHFSSRLTERTWAEAVSRSPQPDLTLSERLSLGHKRKMKRPERFDLPTTWLLTMWFEQRRRTFRPMIAVDLRVR